MVMNDVYLLKLKNLGWSNEKIAAKMGLEVQEVQRRWEALIAETQVNEGNGYNQFCDLFTTMANQYQLLGASLKVVAGVLGNVATNAELEKIITADPEQTLKSLRKDFIILRKFIPITTEEALRQTVEGN